MPVRTIKERLIAFQLDYEYYDGDRRYGYGGFTYQERWTEIWKKIFKDFNLEKNSGILEIGCKKGFGLKDLKKRVSFINWVRRRIASISC